MWRNPTSASCLIVFEGKVVVVVMQNASASADGVSKPVFSSMLARIPSVKATNARVEAIAYTALG
jgi:hypothetical protein